MKTLSMETASRIWNAHREIAVGQKLRDDMAKAIKDGEDPTPLDSWGRRQKLSLGVPCGENSSRMFDVDPKLAVCIIDGHIAAKEKELAEASIVARMELDDGDWPPSTTGA